MLGYTKTKQTGVFRFTPPEIIKALGAFDLDPCTSIVRPWDTAQTHYTEAENGLLLPFFGRVWMNPPYNDLIPWMNKLALHGNGITLVPSRTDIRAFQEFVFQFADSILFIKGRLYFYDEQGVKAKDDCGFPTALVSYGELNCDALSDSGIAGHHMLLNKIAVVVVGVDQTWRVIVQTVLVKFNEPAPLEKIYQEVEAIAGDKIKGNKHYREKIRQQLQLHFRRVKKGHYAN